MNTFLKGYAIPLLLLAPLAVTFAIGERALIYAPISLVVGFVFVHWIPWRGVVLALWIGGGVIELARMWPPHDPASPETYSSFVIEAIVLTAPIILLPVWMGRTLRIELRPSKT